MGWLIIILGIVLIGIGSFFAYYGQHTILGLVLIGIGTFFTFYGQHLLKQKAPVVQHESTEKPFKTLNPREEKLLSTIFNHQKELGLSKLIITRKDGRLHFDEKEKREKYNINIIGEVFDTDKDYEKYSNEFETIILNIPADYLGRSPEARFDNPYVVYITKEGINYLKREK